jgi:hypothetical protein
MALIAERGFGGSVANEFRLDDVKTERFPSARSLRFTCVLDVREILIITSGVSPQPDKACSGRLPASAQAHAGTCGQSGRPPPLATPMHGDRVCTSGALSFALWSEHGPPYAVKDDLWRSDLTRFSRLLSSKRS